MVIHTPHKPWRDIKTGDTIWYVHFSGLNGIEAHPIKVSKITKGEQITTYHTTRHMLGSDQPSCIFHVSDALAAEGTDSHGHFTTALQASESLLLIKDRARLLARQINAHEEYE